MGQIRFLHGIQVAKAGLYGPLGLVPHLHFKIVIESVYDLLLGVASNLMLRIYILRQQLVFHKLHKNAFDFASEDNCHAWAINSPMSLTFLFTVLYTPVLWPG